VVYGLPPVKLLGARIVALGGISVKSSNTVMFLTACAVWVSRF